MDIYLFGHSVKRALIRSKPFEPTKKASPQSSFKSDVSSLLQSGRWRHIYIFSRFVIHFERKKKVEVFVLNSHFLMSKALTNTSGLHWLKSSVWC